MKRLNVSKAVLLALSLSFISSSAFSIDPPTGPRRGNSRPPTNLPPESCLRIDEDTSFPMISIRPIADEYSWTQQQYPVLLFYVPYVGETGQFILYRENTSEPLYQATFSLPDNPGIVSLTIPTALPEVQYHSWYFRANCNTVNGGTSNETISGLIYRSGAEAGNQDDSFYYDRIAETVQRIDLQGQTQQDWLELLGEIDALDDAHPAGDMDFINLTDYGQIPFLGPLTILEEIVENQ